jgi:hypothetical protein
MYILSWLFLNQHGTHFRQKLGNLRKTPSYLIQSANIEFYDMSRRKGEFEHRTAIFEGAFRAWSHLGGLDAVDVFQSSRTTADLLLESTLDDVFDHQVAEIKETTRGAKKGDHGTSKRRFYPSEPLPQSGLAHPYVQAIMSAWLGHSDGTDKSRHAVQHGLATLRTWWQHRRHGESGLAIRALGTDKMKGVVDGYTRHFFDFAHCIVVNDKAEPPRGLFTKMKAMEMQQQDQQQMNHMIKPHDVHSLVAARVDLSNPGLTPFEKPRTVRRSIRKSSAGDNVPATFPSVTTELRSTCVPGKIDFLPDFLEAVVRRSKAAQIVHSSTGGATNGTALPGAAVLSSGGKATTTTMTYMTNPQLPEEQHGDPNTTPVVYASSNGDLQIALTVDGIICAHCMHIIETVLRGCKTNNGPCRLESPIHGLLDAAVPDHRDIISCVLIKIDQAANAKRIAYQATRNLSLVGYKADAIAMSIVGCDGRSRTDRLHLLPSAFAAVAVNMSGDELLFDWTVPCSCPDHGVFFHPGCRRHSSQTNNALIVEAFAARERQVSKYLMMAPWSAEASIVHDATPSGVPSRDNQAPWGWAVDQTARAASASTPPTQYYSMEASQLPSHDDMGFGQLQFDDQTSIVNRSAHPNAAAFPGWSAQRPNSDPPAYHSTVLDGIGLQVQQQRFQGKTSQPPQESQLTFTTSHHWSLALNGDDKSDIRETSFGRMSDDSGSLPASTARPNESECTVGQVRPDASFQICQWGSLEGSLDRVNHGSELVEAHQNNQPKPSTMTKRDSFDL